MQRAIERLAFLISLLALALAIAGCGDDTPKEKLAPVTKAATFEDEYKAEDTWLIYWYLCGTDLETEGGAASADFQELLNVTLPANIKVLI
ncbi:clostripain, partial [Candidatus Saccharibacteria bacterium]|nr:clostripain [Candidatus Saccharibacteria bacterium]